MEDIQTELQKRFRDIWLQDSVVRVVVLTFFGSVIQGIIFLFTFWQPIIDAAYQRSTLSIPAEVMLVYIGIHSAFMFGYALIASVSFVPKRLVSPFYMQFSTLGIILFLGFNSYVQDASISLTSYLSLFTILTAFFFVVQVLLGWMLAMVLKVVIGLTGDEEGLVKEVFQLDVDFDTIKQILLDPDLRKDYNLRIVEDSSYKIVLRTRNIEDIKLVISTMRSQDRQVAGSKVKPSDVALVGYEVIYDLFTNSRRARRRVKALRRDIEADLEERKIVFKPIELKPENEPYESARKLALRPTRSILRQTPSRTIAAVAVMAAIVIGFIVPLVQERIQLSDYLIVAVTVATAIAVLLVPTLKAKKVLDDE